MGSPRLRACLLAMLLACLATAPAAPAANYTVNNTADAPDATPTNTTCDAPGLGPAICTLRAAIQTANNTSTSEPDTITVPAGLYVLDETPNGEDAAVRGDLDITGSTTITGAGARATIVDAKGLDRVFDIRPTGPTVAISGLWIRGGGNLSLAGSTGEGGAGIFNNGALTLTDVAITDNTAAFPQHDGGGIFNQINRPLTLQRVLVARNVAENRGGGIYNNSGGVTVNNSTLSGNSADGGAAYYAAATTPSLTLDEATIADNIDGTAVVHGSGGSTITSRDSILARNSFGNCSGPLASQGRNIDSGTTCGFESTGAGDRSNTDPQLGPLADNGGPTDTHLPAPTSPAVDPPTAGSCGPADQRGFTRPIAACDIGAVELQAPPPPPSPRPASLTLEPSSADREPGETAVVTATLRNDDGSAAADRELRWQITGANPGNGVVTTDANGRAAISWRGIHVGDDTLTVYSDNNTDGAHSPDEPVAQALVRWRLPAPVPGRTVNLDPISGVVTLRRGGRAKTVEAAGNPVFGRLTEARQVPLSTIVDTRRGRVELTTASNRSGGTQKGQFYGGVFQTRQPTTGSRPVAELRLTESLTCRSGRRGKVTASRARSRRLWGNGRGRFRTRGRRSAATVRGTIWLVKDTCDTTTTVVREGVVTVRDFGKRKDVRVRAGRRYVARARKR